MMKTNSFFWGIFGNLSYIYLSFIAGWASLRDVLISTELELKFHGDACVVANTEWGFFGDSFFIMDSSVENTVWS